MEEEDLEEVLEEGNQGAAEADSEEEEVEMGPEAMQMLMEPGIVLAEGEEEEESMEEEEDGVEEGDGTGRWTISN